EDRPPRAHGDAGCGDRKGSAALRAGAWLRVQEAPLRAMDDEDFQSARVATSTTMTVDKFIPQDAIHPIYYDTSYYMVPDGDAGHDIYLVWCEAIASARWQSCRSSAGWCCTGRTSHATSMSMPSCSSRCPAASRKLRW